MTASYKETIHPETLQDADLARLYATYGTPPSFNRPNTFETLVMIILEQQVSQASARAAIDALTERAGGITIDTVLLLDDSAMRQSYVSRQKAGYIRALAEVLQSGELNLSAFATMSDDAVREILLRQHGIGNWTVDIYLLTVLRRMDIFPIGDVAVRTAMKHVKGLPANTNGNDMLTIAEAWRPYRSEAVRILWNAYISDINLRRRIT